jgi:NTP pyrophosphatase (non-canonical NTP hydrolase)
MYQDICAKALLTYGPESQTRMLFEEMAELQKELCKNARGHNNTAEIAEEIADVYIMLRQMVILHGCGEEVQRQVRHKLGRLVVRLNAESIWRDME